MKMVQFFNRVVMMVTTSILAEETPYRRAKIVQKAIKVSFSMTADQAAKDGGTCKTRSSSNI